MTPGADFPVRIRHGIARCVALVVCTSLALSACTFESEPDPPTDASSVGPKDAKLDLSALPVPRAAFCDVLAEDDVAQALEGPVADTAHYGNGDEIEVRPGTVDISHEYGCTFQSADGAVAKAWVFARPVTRNEARSLVRRARRERDCAFPESIGFGTPGLTAVCEVAGGSGQADRLVRARLEGLFGDSWLACEVAEPLEAGGGSGRRADVVRRADQWCTEVVTAVAGRG